MQVDQYVILEPHVEENWEVFPILSNRVCIGFARDCPENPFAMPTPPHTPPGDDRLNLLGLHEVSAAQEINVHLTGYTSHRGMHLILACISYVYLIGMYLIGVYLLSLALPISREALTAFKRAVTREGALFGDLAPKFRGLGP